MMRVVALCVSVALAGCAGGDAGDPGDDGTTGDGDTGTGGDPGDCEMLADVFPAFPEAGGTVVLSGDILSSPGGGEFFQWTVLFANEPIAVVSRAPDDRSVEFVAEQAGAYQIELEGGAGVVDCRTFVQRLNVSEPNAQRRTYELVLTPPLAMAPPQRRTVVVPVGADYDLGTLSLDTGSAVASTVSGPSGPVAAYLRFEPTASTGSAVETFASEAGSFSATLGAGTHDVLVVPSGDLAPVRLVGQTAGDLRAGIAVPAGDLLTGVVRNEEGSPLVGARVALSVAGTPSTTTIADGTGAFALGTRLGGVGALTIVEAGAAGIHLGLQVGPGAGWTPSGAALAVDYTAGFARRVHTFTLVAADGQTPAPGTRVILRAQPIAGAASVADGATAVLADATARAELVADGNGVVGPVSLPDAVYDVLVVPPAASADVPQLVTVDLTSGQPAPARLAAAAGYALSGAASGAARGRVRAVAADVAGELGAPAVSGSIDAQGAFSIVVAPSITLAVTVTPAAGSGRAAVARQVVSGGEGESGEVTFELGAAHQMRGSVALLGAGGVSGVHVLLRCVDNCSVDGTNPVAEAVSTVGGRFALSVPE